ncbi:MAG: RodZ domain-containing protein [Candidatus Omnitrophota bacterium]
MSDRISLGKLFREKREKMDLSREDVSGKTYINIGVITDIEEGIFDKLSPVYMKSFIKKYSEFLGLDGNDMLKKYEGISGKVLVKEFVVESGPPAKEKKSEIPESPVPRGKKLRTVTAVILLGVLVILMVTLINVTKKVLMSPPRKVPVVAPTRPAAFRREAEPVKIIKAEPEKVVKQVVTSKTETKSPVKNGSVTLTLKARDRVWVQVTSLSGDKIFDGFLNSGDSRTWKSENTLRVWTGKGSMLDFTVNGRDLGVIVPGVAKNIQISSEGVLIDNDWAVQFQ